MARGWILFAALIHVVWAPVLLIAPRLLDRVPRREG